MFAKCGYLIRRSYCRGNRGSTSTTSSRWLHGGSSSVALLRSGRTESPCRLVRRSGCGSSRRSTSTTSSCWLIRRINSWCDGWSASTTSFCWLIRRINSWCDGWSASTTSSCWLIRRINSWCDGWSASKTSSCWLIRRNSRRIVCWLVPRPIVGVDATLMWIPGRPVVSGILVVEKLVIAICTYHIAIVISKSPNRAIFYASIGICGFN